MKYLMIIVIKIKYLLGRLFKRIGNLEDEIIFIQSQNLPDVKMSTLKSKGINYRSDLLFHKIKWDFQFDAIQAWERGGADCNSLHRIIQVWLYTKGIDSYLVSYGCEPTNKSHATIIYKDEDLWVAYDYGYEWGKFETLKEAVEKVNDIHNSKLRFYACQDINWKFVNP